MFPFLRKISDQENCNYQVVLFSLFLKNGTLGHCITLALFMPYGTILKTQTQ